MSPKKCGVSHCPEICDWYYHHFCWYHICENNNWSCDDCRIYFQGSKYCTQCWKKTIWESDSLLYYIPQEVRNKIMTYFQEYVIKEDNWTKTLLGSMASDSDDSDSETELS